MEKAVDYVVDLKEIRERFEKLPPAMRRPSVCMPESYTDEEVFDMEVQSIWTYLEDRRNVNAQVNIYTQGLIDNFDQSELDDDDEQQRSLHHAIDYAWCLNRLGEYLFQFLTENQLYNSDHQLIGQCHSLAQGRWLVIRRTQSVHK